MFDGGRTPPEACFAEHLVERRVKANLILIFSTNTNFILSNFKVPTGITGLWQPSVHSDVALKSSMSALPIIMSQKSPNLQYEYKV